MEKKNKPEENETTMHYMPIFMSIGVGIGVGIGAALDNIPIFMSIGIGLGVCIGGVIDAINRHKAEKTEKDSKENGTED